LLKKDKKDKQRESNKSKISNPYKKGDSMWHKLGGEWVDWDPPRTNKFKHFH